MRLRIPLFYHLHKAKGPTAKMLIIVNCMEGCIPFIGDYESEEEKQEGLAEQERMFFVALTRTTRILVISSVGIMRRGDVARMSMVAPTGWYWSPTMPSRFINMLGQAAPCPVNGDDYLRRLERNRPLARGT